MTKYGRGSQTPPANHYSREGQAQAKIEAARRHAERSTARASISSTSAGQDLAAPKPEEKMNLGSMIALAALGIGITIYVFSPAELPSIGTRIPHTPPLEDDPDDEERSRRRRARHAESLEDERRESERIQHLLGAPERYDEDLGTGTRYDPPPPHASPTSAYDRRPTSRTFPRERAEPFDFRDEAFDEPRFGERRTAVSTDRMRRRTT